MGGNGNFVGWCALRVGFSEGWPVAPDDTMWRRSLGVVRGSQPRPFCGFTPLSVAHRLRLSLGRLPPGRACFRFTESVLYGRCGLPGLLRGGMRRGSVGSPARLCRQCGCRSTALTCGRSMVFLPSAVLDTEGCKPLAKEMAPRKEPLRFGSSVRCLALLLLFQLGELFFELVPLVAGDDVADTVVGAA